MKNSVIFSFTLFVFFTLSLSNSSHATNITVSGSISSNTTWTADTIFINGNLTVNNGVTLTINAGKNVIFKGHYGLFIQGRLLAQGTPSSKITFTAANTSTGWSGIRFISTPSTNDTSFITSCMILYGNANTGSAEDQMGGGIFMKSFSKLVISNSIISNCYAARYGGAITCMNDASPVIINNVLCNNTAVSLGGAISLSSGSNPQLINNTIANNHSNAYSGGIDISSSTPVIKNCIFWGNTATYNSQIYPNGYSNVSYCDVQGGWSGTGNINSDPRFISPSSGSGYSIAGFSANWGLGSSTPCVNKGVLSLANYLPSIDFAGNLRVDYDTIDMGAFELLQSDILCGTISSSRTLSKFVIVTCDVSVNNGVTLTVPAGAKVRFMGPYKLNINGRLLAIGAFDNLIRFYPVLSGNPWKGIRFENTASTNDTSKIEYCVIQSSYATGAGTYDNYGGAIFSLNVSKLIIRNNILTNNRAYNYGGAIACIGSAPFIVNNLIANNTVVNGNGGGIYLFNNNSYLISNTISRNNSNNSNGNGIYVNGGSPVFRNNIIWKNNSGGSIISQLYPATGLNVQYCDIEGGTYSGTGNVSTDPLFKSISAGAGYTYDGYSADWALQSTSPVINAGTPTITGFNLPALDIEGRTRSHGTIDLGAFEDVSSINVCGNITQNTTWNASIVHVTCDVQVNSGVTLTIAAGTRVVFDNYYVLRVNGRILALGTPADTIRFYAQNQYIGWKGIRYDSIAYKFGFTTDTSKFSYCKFENAKIDSNGTYDQRIGGAFFTYYFSKIIISNSVFTNNKNALTNPAWGGALGCEYSNPIIRNCTFTNNSAYQGGGLFLMAFDGIIENCFISNNSSYYGGGIYSYFGGNGIITNTVIVNNTSTLYGGGVFLESNILQNFINCTVTNNHANRGGGFGCSGNSDPVLKNCIVYSNKADNDGNEFYLADVASDPKIYYSDIEGGTSAFSGTGAGSNYGNIFQNNVDINPMFISPTVSDGNGTGASYNGLSANWRLQLGSPCINIGTPSITGLGLPDYDLDIKTRVYNGRIDMGAYENQQPIYACGTINSDKIWEADTIKVTCDITIANGATLKISPGTNVQFQGPYKIDVKGRILAMGSAEKMITFNIKDTNYFSIMDSFSRGGWGGIQFNSVATSNDSSKLVYCKLIHAKSSNNTSYARGAALFIYNSNKLLVSNCLLSNNRASYGGSAIYLESSNPRILNCVITNNSVNSTTLGSSWSGAIWLNDASPDFINNTVAHNYGKYSAGLLLEYTSAPLVRNCIINDNYSSFWGTSFSDMYIYSNCQPDISNCIFTTYQTIMSNHLSKFQNNLYGNPRFVSPSSGIGADYDGINADWSLSFNTPALNTGIPSTSSLSIPSEDLAGHQRIMGDTIDMGAYEIQIHPRFLTSQPAAVIACVGTKATFSVSTSITVGYQWQKNGVSIPGATSKTFSINSVAESDSGYYRCLMSNQYGSITSDSAKLTVRTAPAISSQPTPSISACLGGSVNISIAATGTTPLIYQWYDLNGSVSGGSNPTYSINSVTANHASTYHCVVTNVCGTASSNGSTLTINTPVSVTPIPSINSICVGGTLSFSTIGTGSAPITYQWYKGTTAISGATSFSYQITNAQTSHSGTYYCKATNICRSDSTNSSVLTVNTPPAITFQSPSDSICAGQSKTFSISATSSLPVSYQWYYNSTSNAISGATNNIYVINSVSSSNGGLYYCKASNSCGDATTSQISLTVKTAPSITTQSSNLTLCLGQQANFSVTASGTAPLSYRWYKDNSIIAGAVGSSYQITSVTTSDAGNYYCVISNSCGSVNSSLKTLIVNTSPAIVSQSPSDSVCLGASKTFSITATGSSPITFQWYFNSTSNAIAGATNNFYTINAVGSANGGSYYCKASNSCGDATTSQINLTVKSAPVISTQSSNLVLCSTQQANFSVTVSGTAPISYAWFKDNVLISGAAGSSYQINSVSTADAGNYFCVISNSCGSVNSSIKTLTVNTIPVITYQSSGDSVCQGQSKLFTVNTTGSAPISYQWYYNTTSNAISGATNNIYIIGNVGSSNGGLYYCKATNGCGSATTSQISLVVRTAPVISSQSVSATRCLGQSQNFSITATGSPLPKYQWFKDNTAISGATNNTFAISVVSVSDAGNYYCMVSNSCASVQSANQTLFVNTPPDIISQTPNSTKCSGQSFTLDVSTLGTSPITFQWYHSGNPINGAVNNFYSIFNVYPADSGLYYCIASNACGSDQSANINVKVNQPVTVYKQSRDTSKCFGDATLFNVEINGTLPVNYSWYFDNDSIEGAHSSSYFINSVTEANTGNYYCQMTNVCGTVQGAYKELTVRPLPSVHLGNDTTFCLGGNLELSADGPYYCKWNNGSTRSWINVTHSGTFFVYVTDPYGCKNYSDTINITVIEPYPNQAICVVTVDSFTGKNLIAWERVRGLGISFYNIYKETSQTGVYQKIGTVPFDSLSVFIDYNSEPRKKADRYAISIIDSLCANESALSPFHKTIHLTASKGASMTENHLNWNHYEGFTFLTYKIYRGTRPSNMILLDSIASNLNSYTDLNAPNGVAYYQVSAVKLDTCYPDSVRANTNTGPYSQSVSNLKDYTQIPTGYISATPVDAYVGWKDGSTAYFNIYTNLGTWDASTSSNWFTLVKDYQNNILKAVAYENYSAIPRADTIRISGAGVAPQDVVVHQDGATAIRENNPDISLKVYPNPFNYSTNIDYELLNEANVSIEVYNMMGARVATVINQHQLPGKYIYTFDDARTDGIYILRISVNNNTFIKKLIKTE